MFWAILLRCYTVYNIRMSTEPNIVIRKLSKKYTGSESYALKNLSLEVLPGEVYGFLGPNGAGKSTAIRILMNFIQPTSGSASIFSKDIIDDTVAIKSSVGYLSGDFDVYPKMTGTQYITYLSELHGNTSPTYAKELAKRLKAVMNKKMGELSRGQRQKIGIIQAFMHKPQVLILDEPTSGLDPLMQEEFYTLVKEAQARDATIFVSSHIMSEVQKMCTRVGIIRGGELISEKDITELSTEAAQTLELVFASEAPVDEIKKVVGLTLVKHEGNHVTVHMHGELRHLFTVLARHDVTSIDARNLDLEEMFLHFYQTEGKK